MGIPQITKIPTLCRIVTRQECLWVLNKLVYITNKTFCHGDKVILSHHARVISPQNPYPQYPHSGATRGAPNANTASIYVKLGNINGVVDDWKGLVINRMELRV